jgi:hypothetical protein
MILPPMARPSRGQLACGKTSRAQRAGRSREQGSATVGSIVKGVFDPLGGLARPPLGNRHAEVP